MRRTRRRPRRSPTSYAAKVVTIVPIGTDFNVADFFTKPVETVKFHKFTSYILNEPLK